MTIIVLFYVLFKVENYIFNSTIFNMIIAAYIAFKYYNNIFAHRVSDQYKHVIWVADDTLNDVNLCKSLLYVSIYRRKSIIKVQLSQEPRSIQR